MSTYLVVLFCCPCSWSCTRLHKLIFMLLYRIYVFVSKSSYQNYAALRKTVVEWVKLILQSCWFIGITKEDFVPNIQIFVPKFSYHRITFFSYYIRYYNLHLPYRPFILALDNIRMFLLRLTVPVSQKIKTPQS